MPFHLKIRLNRTENIEFLGTLKLNIFRINLNKIVRQCQVRGSEFFVYFYTYMEKGNFKI